MDPHEQGWSCECFRARPVAQQTRRVSEWTAEDASSRLAATPPLQSLKFMPSRCMTCNRRAPADEHVLGFYDIIRARIHSPARRTIVIKVPREDDECNSGYAVPNKSMDGTKDAAQRSDSASENAMTAMGFDTGAFALLCIIRAQWAVASDQVAVGVHRDRTPCVVPAHPCSAGPPVSMASSAFLLFCASLRATFYLRVCHLDHSEAFPRQHDVHI